MDFQQTGNQVDIYYSKASQIATGSWSVGLGIIACVAFFFGTGAIALVFGLLFMAVGIGIIVTATRQYTNIQKMGTMTITNMTIIGGKSSSQTYNSQDITSVNYYDWRIAQRGSGGVDKGGNIVLIMQDGMRIKVASQRNYKMLFVKRTAVPVRDVAMQLASFLGIPMVDGLNKPTSLEELTS